MRHFVLAFFFLIGFFNLSANAQKPPKEAGLREAMASTIVSGEIVSAQEPVPVAFIQHRQIMGTDLVYEAEMKVTKVIKGDVRPGESVTIVYDCASERPDGWTGNMGQDQILNPGQSVTVYMNEKSDGSFSLIEPNGIDRH